VNAHFGWQSLTQPESDEGMEKDKKIRESPKFEFYRRTPTLERNYCCRPFEIRFNQYMFNSFIDSMKRGLQAKEIKHLNRGPLP